MICKIDTNYDGARMSAAVDYHEEKVEAGVALRDEMQLAANDKESIKKALNTHVETFNSTVRKNKFHQVTMSFAPDDKLTPSKKREVVEKWMDHMGYSNHLYVLYHHMDKNHDHWHLIATCSDLEGVRADTRDNYHKSARYSRKLELEYGIRVLSTQAEKEAGNLKDIAREKYAFKRAVEALDPSMALYLKVPEVLRQLKAMNGNEEYTEKQFRSVCARLQKMEQFFDLKDVLVNRGLITISKKEELKLLLREARNGAKNENQYLSRLKEKGVYARKVFKQGVSFQYGYNEFYIKDYHLSRDFTPDALTRYFADPENYRSSTEKKTDREASTYLRKTLHRAVQYSKSFDEFKNYLNQRDITMVLASNSGGVYGYTVTYEDRQYKGSSLDKSLSYSNILERLKGNQHKDIPVFVKKSPKPAAQLPIVSPGIPPSKSPAKSASPPSMTRAIGRLGRALQQTQQEEELTEEEKKRRRRDLGMGF